MSLQLLNQFGFLLLSILHGTFVENFMLDPFSIFVLDKD